MKFSRNVHLGLGNIRVNSSGDPALRLVAMGTKQSTLWVLSTGSKNYERIFMKFSGNVHPGLRHN